jgi:hypothetical protein
MRKTELPPAVGVLRVEMPKTCTGFLTHNGLLRVAETVDVGKTPE